MIYEEILDALNLTSVPVIGTSFGGMMACELAAHRPDRVSKMIVLDPIGLWRDDAPVAPYMLMPPEKLLATLYKHLDSEPVQQAITTFSHSNGWMAQEGFTNRVSNPASVGVTALPGR